MISVGRHSSPENFWRSSSTSWHFLASNRRRPVSIPMCIFIRCAPGGARFLRVKVPNSPGSGKDIVGGKEEEITFRTCISVLQSLSTVYSTWECYAGKRASCQGGPGFQGEQEKNPYIHKTKRAVDYFYGSVYVYFEDGKIVCYDMKNMLDKEVFKPLKDISVFVDACTVMNDALAWDMDRPE